MRFSITLVPALALTAFGAPSYPNLDRNAAAPRSLETMSDYFNLLAAKVEAGRWSGLAPSCDLSKARMPSPAQALPPVSEGLSLKHVSVGRGTQNYTCDAGNATAVPQAAGAVATLFNVSCIAVAYPDLLDLIPKVSMQFDLPVKPLDTSAAAKDHHLGPSSAVFSGDHFFHDATTPFFHIQENGERIADAYCGLNSSTPAPSNSGAPAVPWLKLVTKEGTTDDVREVYRVTTAGGTAPKSCADMEATFQVQYAAAYWFYAGPAPPEEDDEE